MADNVDLSSLTGTCRTDDVGGVQYQVVKLDVGGDGVSSPVTTTGLPVNDASGSLTVDAPVATPVFVRLSDGSAAIATLPVSLASVPSHAVTNAGTFAVQVSGVATDAKLDTIITHLDGVETFLDGLATGAETQPVSAASLPLPTGAATLAEQQTQTTALQLIDDAVYTDGTGTPSKAIGVAGTDGTNPQILKTDSAGELQVDVLTLPALVAGTAAIGKLAANSGVDIGDVDITSIAAGDNNIGNVDIVTLPGDVEADIDQIRDQIDLITPDIEEIRVDADAIRVAVETIDNAVSGSGFNTSQINGVAPLMGAGNTGTGSLRVTIASDQATVATTPAGNVAHDAADSGNPVKIGGKAHQTNPTAVTDGDRVNAMYDDVGRQVVVSQPRDLVGTQHVQIASSSSETTIITAGGAGVFNDVSLLAITNQTAIACTVTIKDDTAGTTRAIIALAALGGAVIPYPVPLPQAVANKPWTATLSVATTTVNFHSVFVKNV